MWSINVKFLLTFALITVLLQPSCVFSSNQTTENINRNGEKKMLKASENIDELVKTLNLKRRPTKAVWIEEKLGSGDDRVPGPTDYRLVAVLNFSASDSAQIIEEAEKIEKSSAGTTEIESWFPADLKKLGSDELNCLKYNADSFTNSPYSGGTLFRVKDTETFILRLNSF